MKLSKKMREYFIREIQFASAHIRSAPTPAAKLYFFSIVFGTANRIINIEYDPELSFIHNVTNAAHNQMLVSLNSQGVPTIDADLFNKLADYIDELAKLIATGEKTYQVLESISNLSYSTTGNGHYLAIRGKLTL